MTISHQRFSNDFDLERCSGFNIFFLRVVVFEWKFDLLPGIWGHLPRRLGSSNIQGLHGILFCQLIGQHLMNCFRA